MYIDEKNENLGQNFGDICVGNVFSAMSEILRSTTAKATLFHPFYLCKHVTFWHGYQISAMSESLVMRKNYGYTRGFQSNLVTLVTHRASQYWRLT
jgi:hypothetical protein